MFFARRLINLATRSASSALPRVIRKEDALRSLERWKGQVERRLDSLNYDGLHDASAHVVDKFHNTYFALERQNIEEGEVESGFCCGDKASIHCAKTSDENPIQGTAVIAKFEGVPFGRLFFTHLQKDKDGVLKLYDHLTTLNIDQELFADNFKPEDEGVVVANMITAYFDKMNRSDEEKEKLLKKKIFVSCISYAGKALEKISGHEDEDDLFIHIGETEDKTVVALKKQIVFEDLYKAARKFLAKESAKEEVPSTSPQKPWWIVRQEQDYERYMPELIR